MVTDLSKKIKERYEANPKICPFCRNPIPYDKRKNKFCNRKCSASFNNKGIRRHGKGPKPCLRCGNLTSNAKYCSTGCYSFDIQGWLDGRVDGGGRGKTGGCKAPVREFLIDQCGNRCSKCGWSEFHLVTGKVPLEVNHIDGDAYNNSVDNLEVLCPNCHSLTPNYRSLNKVSKRSHRNKNG